MDQTPAFWNAIFETANSQGLSRERLTKLKSAQILRSLAGKSEFIRAAVEVAQNISALRRFVGEHRRDYVQSGRLQDSERDRIEEQVGLYVRSCTENIKKLEDSIKRAEGLSPQSSAHRHGVRYKQLMVQRQKQQKRQREIQQAEAHSAANLRLNGHTWARQPERAGGGGQDLHHQQQMEAENQALAEELRSLGKQVAQTETSMRELAALNQMFSTQVLHQSEQTRQLYNQAVQATEFVSTGNVQLEKAIRLNSSTRKLLFVFFLVASLLLLLFDWWSS